MKQIEILRESKVKLQKILFEREQILRIFAEKNHLYKILLALRAKHDE